VIADRWQRREFVGGVGALTLAAAAPALRAAEPPPETTRIRLQDAPIACFAPLYVAEALLRAEGFTDVQYVKTPVAQGPGDALASGLIDIAQDDAAAYMMQLNRRAPIVVLGGLHTGCWELFAQRSIHSLRDLKGKTVAAPEGSSRKAFISAMVSSVGLDPRRDLVWTRHESEESIRLFEQGKLDALLGFVPEPQVLRAKKVGHVLLDTMTDRPWSQYFCCLAASNQDFVRKHPIATKRALRALLKAVDLCVSQPENAARLVSNRGVPAGYDYVLQAVREIGYSKWREYESEDTMRFWSLRLRDLGIIKSDPKTLLARGTDWRFIRDLKKELKA
jgi:NitT/TauT family transport system substrate-binding protein